MEKKKNIADWADAAYFEAFDRMNNMHCPHDAQYRLDHCPARGDSGCKGECGLFTEPTSAQEGSCDTSAYSRILEWLGKGAEGVKCRIKELLCDIDWRTLCLFQQVVYVFKCPHCKSFCAIPFTIKKYRDEAGLFSRVAACPHCAEAFYCNAQALDEVTFYKKTDVLPNPDIFLLDRMQPTLPKGGR